MAQKKKTITKPKAPQVDKQIPIPEWELVRRADFAYRTLENHIDGVVITFSDIATSKKLEAELRARNNSQQWLIW